MSELTGVAELERKFHHLAGKAAVRVSRKAVNAGLKVIEKEIKAGAPRGLTGGLVASIGSRNKRRRSEQVAEAKAGIGVGKNRKKRGLAAPHAHLVALGTKPRARRQIGGAFAWITRPTRAQLATGTMPHNAFVREAYENAKGRAADRMMDALAKGIEQEAAKR